MRDPVVAMRSKGAQESAHEPPVAMLINAIEVGSLLSCSARHVVRLAEAERLPKPLRLGSLVRWRRTDIESWIAQGCPGAEARRDY